MHVVQSEQHPSRPHNSSDAYAVQGEQHSSHPHCSCDTCMLCRASSVPPRYLLCTATKSDNNKCTLTATSAEARLARQAAPLPHLNNLHTVVRQAQCQNRVGTSAFPRPLGSRGACGGGKRAAADLVFHGHHLQLAARENVAAESVLLVCSMASASKCWMVTRIPSFPLPTGSHWASPACIRSKHAARWSRQVLYKPLNCYGIHPNSSRSNST